MVAGQQFSMPRSIKKLIYYDRKTIHSGNWAFRVCRKFFRVKKTSGLPQKFKVSYRPLPIYRQALDFARMQNYNDFVRKLRSGAEMDGFKIPRSHLYAVCSSEEIDRKNRESDATKIYLKSLKKQKYG